jgi:hypothetical protein
VPDRGHRRPAGRSRLVMPVLQIVTSYYRIVTEWTTSPAAGGGTMGR